MTDVGKFVIFKPVPGGYVYRAPNSWLFGPRDHYLVNEAQKAEILAMFRSWSRPVFWIGLSLLLGVVSFLWAASLRGLSSILIMIVLTFSIFTAVLISRRLLLRRLRPILGTLPPTNERITNLESRQAIAKAGLLGGRPIPNMARITALLAGILTYLYLPNALDLPQQYALLIGFGVFVIVAVLWPLLARLFQAPTR